MEFVKPTSEIYAPDNQPAEVALARTTHLGVSAHQDDLEIMAMEGILAGFGQDNTWFTGVVVTNGAGSARDNLYARYTDEEMQKVRRREQKKAAYVGEFAAAVFLDYSSKEVRDPAAAGPVEDLQKVIRATRPEVMYIHNLADKHPTHIGTSMKAVTALRGLPRAERPAKLYGCEVWRDLDWLLDEEKVVFRLDRHENIQMSLVGLFDSQVVGGKRYDLATMGRRRAHATYFESHETDECSLLNYGMDLTPLIEDDTLDVASFVRGHVDRFADAVQRAIEPFL